MVAISDSRRREALWARREFISVCDRSNDVQCSAIYFDKIAQPGIIDLTCAILPFATSVDPVYHPSPSRWHPQSIAFSSANRLLLPLHYRKLSVHRRAGVFLCLPPYYSVFHVTVPLYLFVYSLSDYVLEFQRVPYCR